MVYLTRNTCIALTEVDNWSYFEFEMFMSELQEKLKEEEIERKKQQRKQQQEQHSMQSQMNTYMRNMNLGKLTRH